MNCCIFDPDGNGKTKFDHAREMILSVIADKQLPFKTVLIDTWYTTQDSLGAAQQACGMRWNIDQHHRERKQLAGVGKCQCRKAGICAMLVWIRLMQAARQTERTIRRIKRGLSRQYLRQELKQPSLTMKFVGTPRLSM